MKKIIYLLFTATFFLATACDKEDDLQCDRTSTNHNILCCKINGEDWTPAGGGPDVISPFDLQYYSDTGWFGLLAGNSTDNNVLKGSIYIIANDLKIGTNSIIDNESLWHIHNHNSNCELYEDLVNSSSNNYVNITKIDSVNYHMTGEFQFSAINECQDTIKVTDGYFDLNYFF